MEKKLTKSTDKTLNGVCAGLAEYFNMDATLVRVLYAGMTAFLAGFPSLILYIILARVMPEKAAE